MNEVIERAKTLGLCDEWYEEMKNTPTIERFCDMYFRGDDWAKENDFPQLDLLQKYKDQTAKYGLKTDFEGKLENLERVAFFGNSKAEIEYTGFVVAKIIARHQTRLKITARNYAIVYVDVLDDAQVEINENDNAQVKIFRK